MAVEVSPLALGPFNPYRGWGGVVYSIGKRYNTTLFRTTKKPSIFSKFRRIFQRQDLSGFQNRTVLFSLSNQALQIRHSLESVVNQIIASNIGET